MSNLESDVNLSISVEQLVVDGTIVKANDLSALTSVAHVSGGVVVVIKLTLSQKLKYSVNGTYDESRAVTVSFKVVVNVPCEAASVYVK